jgi:hypothetical protein
MSQHLDFGHSADQHSSEPSSIFGEHGKHLQTVEHQWPFDSISPSGKNFDSHGVSAGSEFLSNMSHNTNSLNVHAGYNFASLTSYLPNNGTAWGSFDDDFNGASTHHVDVHCPSQIGKGKYQEINFNDSPYSSGSHITQVSFESPGDHFQPYFAPVPALSSPIPQFLQSSSSLTDANITAMGIGGRRLAASHLQPLAITNSNLLIATLPSNADAEGKNWHFPKIVPRELSTTINQHIQDCRDNSISYKDIQESIKQKFGYELKTPTLRTRMRTKIRKPSERLRNPVWTANDVSILFWFPVAFFHIFPWCAEVYKAKSSRLTHNAFSFERMAFVNRFLF